MPNSVLTNFAAGETSPRSRGRFDLAWFNSACQKLVNYVAEVPGPARYRSGFRIAHPTRNGAVARLIPFQLNDSQGYMLEFTDGKMRVYKNGRLQKLSRTAITAVTRAQTAVITVNTTTNLSVGDHIILEDIEGMFELNGREFILGANVGSTFELLDPVTGVGIDSRNYGAYTSGGWLYEVYEVSTPYLEEYLDNLQWAQSNTTMYLACVGIAPRKLTVDSADGFTLSTISFTSSPFAAGTAINVQNAVQSTSGYVVFPVGTSIDENIPYTAAAVGGMTQLNGNSYRLRVFSLIGIPESPPPAGVYCRLLNATTLEAVDTSGYGAYTSGGTFTPQAETPLGVAFYESRLFFTGTNQRPNTLFGSRAPDDDGNTRYEDFTGGTNADDAVFFALAPASGQVDYMAWGRGTSKYLFVGTFGGPFRVSGSGLDEPITPSSINVRQLDLAGCEAVMPAGGSRVFFVMRGGTAVRTVRYNADIDDFETYDMLLNAEHIAASRIRRVALQSGRPEILWVIREDGVLSGMTVQGAENVAGWHRHVIGGQDGKVLDVQPLPRSDKDDQLWVVTERAVAGVTRRFVEYQADPVEFPDLEDFFTGGDRVFADGQEDEPGWREEGKREDLAAWQNACYRRQEEYIHVDCAGTYNGSDRGVDAEASLTPGEGALTVGELVTFTTAEDVFKSTDVDSELWKKPNRDTGLGSGRATIVEYISATEVVARIEVAFDTLEAIEAGEWYFAVDTFYVPHLDGEIVAVVVDGAVYSDGRGNRGYPLVRVQDAKVTLSGERVAAVAHIGLRYTGFLKTHNLEAGGRSGPAQSKPRNISELFVRFLSSLGTSYGTDLYKLEQIQHRTANAKTDRPAVPFSGIKRLSVADSWQAEEEKHVVMVQDLPLPSVIQFLDIHYSFADEE